MDEPTLKDMCLICHLNPPKYRCPRCLMRTCSLACSKRHKARAQCSGVRDPAAYVKKNELATPAAIDRDYNFLTAVERHLDRAEQDVLERGMPPLVPDDFNFKKRHRWQKGEHNLSSAFQQARVRVKRAPVGLQRHKLNKTRLDHQAKSISWTIEWVDEQGQRKLTTAFDSLTVYDAYCRAIEDPQRRRKRQKLNREEPCASIQAPSSQTARSALPDGSSAASMDGQIAPTEPNDGEAAGANVVNPKLHFYLLRPQTATTVPVIIPVPHSSTISDCLRDRVVLEFPTFYALPDPPDALPAAFMAEAEYFLEQLGQTKEVLPSTDSADQATSPAKESLAPPQTCQDDAVDGRPQPISDVQLILEMLKEDSIPGGAQGEGSS